MRLVLHLTLVCCLAAAASATAAPTSYTNRGAFDAAVAGIGPASAQPVVIGLDDRAAGTRFPTGTGLGGVTFAYAIGTFDLAVRGGTSTAGGTSGLNTLALRNSTNGNSATFTSGDLVRVDFARPTHAFGFYVVVGPSFDFFPQDVNLTFAGTTYSMTGSEAPGPVGANGAHAVWVGIVDPAAAYTTATVRFGPVGASPGGSFELDDLSFATAVPEPAAAAIALVGLVVWGGLARRRK